VVPAEAGADEVVARHSLRSRWTEEGPRANAREAPLHGYPKLVVELLKPLLSASDSMHNKSA
jgi:hypothetical protein